MPRLKVRVPKYRLHKASGQAVVTLNGRDIYLGAYGSPESEAEYHRLVAEWQLNGRQHPLVAPIQGRTIDELIAAYVEFAAAYYVKHGRPTTTQCHIREVLRFLHDRYDTTPAEQFGPLALKAVRQAMIESTGWSRETINKATGTIKRMFKWAAENELAPASVYHALQTVSGLRRGRCQARETDPVKPVPQRDVDITLPHLSRQVRVMVELQLLTGMRPGEVVLMRTCDLDTSGKIWTYTPESHKTEHHDRERVIHLGQRAQKLVRPFLRRDLNAYLFSPSEAEGERRAERHRQRKTPLSCGNRPGTSNGTGERAPGDRYTVASYRRAIERACDIAFPPPEWLRRQKVKGRRAQRWETKAEWRKRLGPKAWAELERWLESHRWAPNQLRHTAGTFLRKEFGLDAARTILGHSSPVVTEIYAELDREKAATIMAKVG